MKQNSSLVKKLASYSAFASAVFACSKGDAQIVYHDVNPDFVIPESTDGMYYLDLNSDGVDDFRFLVNEFGGITSVYFSSVWNQGNYYPEAVNGAPFDAGQVISAGNNWSSSFLLAYFSSSTGGTGWWLNESDKYIGLRFPLSNNYYYGWARLEVLTGGNSFVIKDFAYETQPNTSIVAGATGCGSTPVTPVIAQLVDESLMSSVATGNQWYVNGNLIPGATNDTYSASQTGFYTTYVTDYAGCVASSSPFDFVKCDSVNTNAIMIADTSGNNICSGSIALFHLLEGLHSNYQLQWYMNDVAIAGATSNYYTTGAITISSSFYGVVSNSITGCSDTTQTFVLNVLSLPPTPVITQSYDTLSTDAAYSSYQWKTGYSPVTIPGATQNYYVMTSSNYYSVKVTGENGCSATSANTFYDKCGYFQPTLTINGYTDICEGDSVLLETSFFPNCTYSWTRDNELLNDFDTATYASQAGSYVCTIHDTIHNCSWLLPITIEVSILNAPILIAGDSLITIPDYAYQWLLDSIPIPGATSQSYHPDTSGYYSVQISDPFGCTALSNSLYYAGVPTLVESDLNELQNEKWLGGSLKVFNVFGQEIFSGIVEEIPFNPDLENFGAGIYYVMIRKEDSITVIRILNTR